MNTQSAALQYENEQVVTFTLVELLTTLVFIAMALALVLKDEALKDLSPTQERMQELLKQHEVDQKEIRRRDARIAVLEARLDEQQKFIQRLLKSGGATLPPGEYKIVPTSEVNKGINAEAVVKELLEQNAALRREIAKLKGGGDLTRPKCPTNPGFLVRAELLSNGSIAISPMWPQTSSGIVAKVNGIRQLTGAGAMSRAEFMRRASVVDDWGRSQPVPCAFSALAVSQHSNLSLYLQQLSAVEQYFYVRRSR